MEMLLKKHGGQIVKGVRAAARQSPGVDFDDLTAEARCLFVRAYRKWDGAKSSFSTYLTIWLQKLLDYHQKEIRRASTDAVPQHVETGTGDYKSNPETDSCFMEEDTAETVLRKLERERQAGRLSEDAQVILRWLLSREWETPEVTRKPTLTGVTFWFTRRWGWRKGRVAEAWAELRQWWTDPAVRESLS